MANLETNDAYRTVRKNLAELAPDRTSVWLTVWMWLPATCIVLSIVLVIFFFAVAGGRTGNYDDVVANYREIKLGMTQEEVEKVFQNYDLEPIAQTGSSDQTTYAQQKIRVKLIRYKDADHIVIFYENSRVIGKKLFWISDPYPEEDFPTVLPPEYTSSR